MNRQEIQREIAYLLATYKGHISRTCKGNAKRDRLMAELLRMRAIAKRIDADREAAKDSDTASVPVEVEVVTTKKTQARKRSQKRSSSGSSQPINLVGRLNSSCQLSATMRKRGEDMSTSELRNELRFYRDECKIPVPVPLRSQVEMMGCIEQVRTQKLRAEWAAHQILGIPYPEVPEVDRPARRASKKRIAFTDCSRFRQNTHKNVAIA